MENIEQKVRQTIYTRLSVAELLRLYGYTIMDWGLVRRALEEYLLPILTNLVAQLIEKKEENIRELEDPNMKLSAKLNLHTGSDPQRDHRIVDLYEQVLSRAQIAKEVGMFNWGK